ncbi:MAG: FAD-binding oxidoreductase [Thaumarchaeota archaeon]|nr:FAD-binding oxidoreductase [Nitrososphaerota archaeon]
MKSKEIGPDLERIVKGHVLWDKHSLDLYSVDSSSYILRPLVITIPKDESDVIRILKYAAKNKIGITPRGAGTGLVGSALGRGIIIDLRNFNKIRIGHNHVEADCGVFKGNLDEALRKKGGFFPPDPSIGPYCTIGGMVATNASGSHTLKYGSTIDNLLSVRMIRSDGKIMHLPSKSQFANRIYDITRSDGKSGFPDITKNSCGYRLDAVTSKLNLQKLIAGSEGTLGIIISTKLKILPIPKKNALMVLAYRSIRKAAIDSPKIVKLKPSALEIVDKNIIKYINVILPKDIECLLFVEFDSRIKSSVKILQNIISDAKIVKILTKKSEIKKWWKYRNSALSYSLRSIASNQTMPTVIEDAVVPVEKLVLLVDLIEEVSEKYGIKFVLYGHAGNGNLHIRPILRQRNKKLIKKIATEFFSKLIQMGGCITAEHGDGLARSEFVKMQYGNRIYSVFDKVKRQFDPKNILNPGKIITHKSSIIKNLKI